MGLPPAGHGRGRPLAWPIRSSITREGMTASSNQVAKVCRRSCGPRRSRWADRLRPPRPPPCRPAADWWLTAAPGRRGGCRCCHRARGRTRPNKKPQGRNTSQQSGKQPAISTRSGKVRVGLSRDCTTGPAHDAGILAEARDAYRWKVTAPDQVVVANSEPFSTRGQGAGRAVAAGPLPHLDGQTTAPVGRRLAPSPAPSPSYSNAEPRRPVPTGLWSGGGRARRGGSRGCG